MTKRYETTPTTKNDMGSPVTKPATQHELAEATREPSSGRPQPHSTTTVGAERSAAPAAAATILKMSFKLVSFLHLYLLFYYIS